MKKSLMILLAGLLMLAGCAGNPKNDATSLPENTTAPETEIEETAATTSLKILSPTGAPALALLDLLIGSPDSIMTVDGSDVLQAAFINPSSEYDVILAPTNLGAQLASKGKTDYRLAGIVTWGNLFIVGSDETVLQDSSKQLAAFGETAVPGLVFSAVLEQLDIQAEITWYNSVSEAQAALLSKNADAALIAEPAATATIAKAKQDGMNLSIIADLQASWKEKTGFDGYPQAAVFVLNSVYAEKTEEVQNLLKQIEATLAAQNDSSQKEALIAKVDKVGTDILGTPSGSIVAEAYAGMNLVYRPAEEVKEELQAFLSLFGITDLDSIYLTEAQ